MITSSIVESVSGETLEVPVSALKQTGLDKLLEAIHLQSELLDLKANPKRSAEGVVIEAKLERGRGPVGTALVQRGTLRVGDIVGTMPLESLGPSGLRKPATRLPSSRTRAGHAKLPTTVCASVARVWARPARRARLSK